MAQIFDFIKRAEINMYETNVVHVSDFFLTKAPMTHKKLQKLCYYAYAWYLTLKKRRLFHNQFEAWIHGPVDTSLYSLYKSSGWQPVPQAKSHPIANEEILEVLEQVYESYGDLSGDELERLTHQETPWIQARNGKASYEPSTTRIEDDVIKSYYLKVYEDGQND